MKAMVRQDNHVIFKGLDERMKERIMNIRSGTRPATHQTFLVEQAANLAAYDPATVRIPFLPNLLVTTSLPTGMQQLYSIAVHHAQYGRFRQKPICPGSMCFEPAEQSRSLGQFREPKRKGLLTFGIFRRKQRCQKRLGTREIIL